MFLAAAPYFQRRFHTSKTLLKNFQPTEVSVSTVANLGSMLILTRLQANASYPRRISIALITLTVAFLLLAISTKTFLSISAQGYFAFMVLMVLVSSTAVGFMQNGIFSFVSGYGRPEYMQSLMLGQAVAGVLPPLVQIISVLSTGADDDQAGTGASTSAMVYFLTATGISGVSLMAFLYLLRMHPAKHTIRRPDSATSSRASSLTEMGDDDLHDSPPTDLPTDDSVPLTLLARKLFYRASAVFLTFAVTMVFPVFTQEIASTTPSTGALFRKDAFIPFAFLVWNAGDLLGRIIPLSPPLALAARPKLLLLLSVLRVVFVPLYLLCNVTNPEEASSQAFGARMPDAFYLLIVQLPFGVTNGYLGSCCMMGASDQVEEHEKEASGGFMGLCLVGGLAVGSLLSFFVGNG